MKKFFWTVAIVFLSEPFSSAQTPGEIVQRALQAHGASAVNDITAVGTTTWNAETRPTVVYAKRDGSFRIETGPTSSRNIVVFSKGLAWSGVGELNKRMSDHVSVRRPEQFPFFDLLSEAGNPNAEISYNGLKSIGSAIVHHITMTIPDRYTRERSLRRALDERADFYIDAQTFLVVRSARFLLTEEAMDLRVPSMMDFSDYRNVNGVQIPFRIVNASGTPEMGLHSSTVAFTSVIINSNVADSLFVGPAQGSRR